jgi:hypothetical protein
VAYRLVRQRRDQKVSGSSMARGRFLVILKIIVVKAGGWIFFVRDTCGAGTGCMFQK